MRFHPKQLKERKTLIKSEFNLWMYLSICESLLIILFSIICIIWHCYKQTGKGLRARFIQILTVWGFHVHFHPKQLKEIKQPKALMAKSIVYVNLMPLCIGLSVCWFCVIWVIWHGYAQTDNSFRLRAGFIQIALSTAPLPPHMCFHPNNWKK